MYKICLGGIVAVLLLFWASMLFAAGWEIVWESNRPPSWSLFAVDFVNAKDGWMTGTNNVIRHTDDGGITWRAQDSRILDFGRWWDVSFISPTQGWICGYSRAVERGQTIHWGAILHTTDGGRTWNLQKRLNDIPLIIQFFTTKKGIALGGGGTVFQTMDGGKTWEEHPHLFWGAVYGGYFVNLNEGWVVGNRVFHTTDGGKTWEDQITPGVCLDEAYFINPKEGWVGGEGQIFHTTDGGTTWQRQTLPACPRVEGIYFANAREGWVIGGELRLGMEGFGVILHTTDSGTTWEVQHRFDEFLVDICSGDAGHLWALGHQGTVLAYFDPNLFSVIPAGMKLTGWGNVKQGVE